MKQLRHSITAILFLTVLFVSCKKNSPGGGSQNNASANTVNGTIYDAKGNKFNITNSSVVIRLSAANGGGANAYSINMETDSRYEKKVAEGLYTYDARAWTSLNGKVVSVPLDPIDGKAPATEFNSKPGVTRDFQLKLTGLIPGSDPANVNSYYGGKIFAVDGPGTFTATGSTTNLAVKYPGSSVLFILTPKGPCVDGSTAPISEISTTVENLQNSGRYLANFPLAKYYLSALLKKPTGQQSPLRLNFISGATGARYDLLSLTFSPAANDQECRPTIEQVAVWDY